MLKLLFRWFWPKDVILTCNNKFMTANDSKILKEDLTLAGMNVIQADADLDTSDPYYIREI